MQPGLFKKNAVLMEQDFVQCRLYEDLLEASGFDVYIAKSAMDALTKIRQEKQDIAIINTEIAEDKFIKKFVEKIKTEENSLPIIGISIYSKEKKQNIANILDNFLTKPFSIDTFMNAIDGCLEEGKNGCENSDYQ